MRTIAFILENKEVLTTFILSLIAIVKLTAWGRAQSAALDTVVGVIERVGVREIKNKVAAAQINLPSAAKDALNDSVAKVDTKKSPLTVGWKIAREVFRGIF